LSLKQFYYCFVRSFDKTSFFANFARNSRNQSARRETENVRLEFSSRNSNLVHQAQTKFPKLKFSPRNS